MSAVAGAKNWQFACVIDANVRPIAFLLLFISSSAFAQSHDCLLEWQALRPGLEYRAINCLNPKGDVDVHVFRVDLDRWSLNAQVVDGGSTAHRLFNASDAGLVLNGNFFDQARHPLGVLMSGGHELQPPRASDWQSIFLVTDDDEPMIVMPNDWPSVRDDAVMAVQAGPRLVVAGKPVHVKPSYASERTGVCIQRSGQLLFFVTPRGRKFSMVDTVRLATAAESDGGLACYNAMLFDGGHSTQVYTEAREKAIEVFGDPVPVFVTATRK